LRATVGNQTRNKLPNEEPRSDRQAGFGRLLAAVYDADGTLILPSLGASSSFPRGCRYRVTNGESGFGVGKMAYAWRGRRQTTAPKYMRPAFCRNMRVRQASSRQRRRALATAGTTTPFADHGGTGDTGELEGIGSKSEKAARSTSRAGCALVVWLSCHRSCVRSNCKYHMARCDETGVVLSPGFHSSHRSTNSSGRWGASLRRSAPRATRATVSIPLWEAMQAGGLQT